MTSTPSAPPVLGKRAGLPHPPGCPVCSAIVRVVAGFKESGQTCWLSQLKLGQYVGRSERSIRTHLRALETAGQLRTHRRGLTSTNVYSLGDQRRPRNAAARCRSGAAKIADNTVPRTSSGDGIKKQAPAASPQRDDAFFNPTNGTTQPADLALIERMIAAGMSPRRAATLAAQHDSDRIGEQIEWLRHRRADNPGAVLATAIIDGWPEPKAARVGRVQRTRAEAAIEAEAADRDREAAARSAREAEQRKIVAAEATIPPATIERLRRESHEEIDATFYRRASRTGGPFCDAVEALLREKLLAEVQPPEALSDAEKKALEERARRDLEDALKRRRDPDALPPIGDAASTIVRCR